MHRCLTRDEFVLWVVLAFSRHRPRGLVRRGVIVRPKLWLGQQVQRQLPDQHLIRQNKYQLFVFVCHSCALLSCKHLLNVLTSCQ